MSSENLDQRLVALKARVTEAQQPKAEKPHGLAALYEIIASWGERRVSRRSSPHQGF